MTKRPRTPRDHDAAIKLLRARAAAYEKDAEAFYPNREQGVTKDLSDKWTARSRLMAAVYNMVAADLANVVGKLEREAKRKRASK